MTETARMIQRYLRSMERAEYATLLNVIENYARIINSLFTQYKPHDDRHPEPARRDALYSSFYVLKTLMIMLYPIVPQAMERLRESLRLDPMCSEWKNLAGRLHQDMRSAPSSNTFLQFLNRFAEPTAAGCLTGSPRTLSACVC